MPNQIPGVPAGWEMVRIGKPEIGEWFIDGLDNLVQAIDDNHFYGCVILRKIEKPATYRPFANAEEYAPHFDRAIKPKAVSTMAMRVIKYSDIQVFFVSGLSLNSSSYEDAFYGVEFTDGTPFGVKIDE
jgi:hypothetical protein